MDICICIIQNKSRLETDPSDPYSRIPVSLTKSTVPTAIPTAATLTITATSRSTSIDKSTVGGGRRPTNLFFNINCSLLSSQTTKIGLVCMYDDVFDPRSSIFMVPGSENGLKRPKN